MYIVNNDNVHNLCVEGGWMVCLLDGSVYICACMYTIADCNHLPPPPHAHKLYTINAYHNSVHSLCVYAWGGASVFTWLVYKCVCTYTNKDTPAQPPPPPPPTKMHRLSVRITTNTSVSQICGICLHTPIMRPVAHHNIFS